LTKIKQKFVSEKSSVIKPKKEHIKEEGNPKKVIMGLLGSGRGLKVVPFDRGYMSYSHEKILFFYKETFLTMRINFVHLLASFDRAWAKTYCQF